MKTIRHLSVIFCLLALCFNSKAQESRLDIHSYNLTLDISHLRSNHLVGDALLSGTFLTAETTTRLLFNSATIDSLVWNGTTIDTPAYTYDGRTLTINTPSASAGEPFTLHVFYSSPGYVESYGWGGFHFNANIIYNIGVCFRELPHGIGRSWFPTNDDFTDKATYTLNITSPVNWTTTASGIRQSATRNSDGSESSSWVLSHPTSSYLISVAVGPFSRHSRTIHSLYGDYPLIVAYHNYDSTTVASAFTQLDNVVPFFERCFGPYRWETIGYTVTPIGSMEHVNNISLVTNAITDQTQTGQGVIAHELAHAWFGNLLTCASSSDMWMQEGGASFCEEVAAEAVHGKTYSNKIYETKLEEVLRTTHIHDNGFKPLYGQEAPTYTYGSTTYDKGATVWHSLRGYLGDSLFYSTMKRLFAGNAFSNLDSYALRDTLSSLSGVDLTNFFHTHVFSAGFVDYVVDSLASSQAGSRWNTTISLRQKFYGRYGSLTDVQNKIPVTFFKGTRPIATHTFAFTGTTTTQDVVLDERPDFAIIDFYETFSDAVTDGYILLSARQPGGFPLAHFKYTMSSWTDTAFLHVAHHWGKPDGEYRSEAIRNPGICRMANRYWVVSGSIPESAVSMRGYFRCGKGSTSTYPFLDDSLYRNSREFDSIRLLYREDCRTPWRVIESSVSGNSTSGWLYTDELKTGEYTLAIVNDSLLSINEPSQATNPVRIYPNPSSSSVIIDAPSEVETLYLTILDISGRTITSSTPVANHASFQHNLSHGTYIFQLETQKTQLGSYKIIVE